MAVHTILLDFCIDGSIVTNPGKQEVLISNIETGLAEFIPELKRKFHNELPGGFITLFSAVRGTFVTVRGFAQGMLTVNIEYYKEDEAPPLVTYESSGKLQDILSGKIGCQKSHRLPVVKRNKLDRYFISSDERLLEYDIDEVLFEERSPYQKVQIVHSKSFGNLLLLDDLQNLSERDLIYTETLMQRGKEDYRGKEIVILGGGDGALLWELLKESPKHVIMLELDDVVMKACRKYMRSVCGDCLDHIKGSNYEIVVDDCVRVLDRFINEGQKFDYVFGDLTDVPISSTPQGEIWDFIRHILNSSLKVLKPGGKYMTHANGASNPASLEMLEDQLMKLEQPVTFTQDRAFVPSFMEDWVFYQVTLKQ